MFSPNEPLWLPRGSVRAILAIVLVAAVIGLSYQGKIEPKDLAALAGIVVAFYFAGRNGAKPVA